MSAPLLEVRGLSKRFGGFTALRAVDMVVGPGERVGLIGPNGSGKTTLINCISGALRHDQGVIRLAGQDISRLPAHRRTRLGIARSFQIPRPFHSMTALENLAIPLEYVAHRGSHRTSTEHEAREIRDEGMHILEQMNLQTKADAKSEELTQIELRKLELARALAARPQLLLADEAMAGLSGGEIDEVLEILLELNTRGIAVLMIEHIMRAVMGFSERVVCLDAGARIAEGTPELIVQDPVVERAYLGE